jgi:hypothetical protein
MHLELKRIHKKLNFQPSAHGGYILGAQFPTFVSDLLIVWVVSG